MRLRAPYAMPGTEMLYAATRCYATKSGAGRTLSYHHTLSADITLRYRPTRVVLRQRVVLWYGLEIAYGALVRYRDSAHGVVCGSLWCYAPATECAVLSC
eukprot:2995970-Rhodomonas_salina.2